MIIDYLAAAASSVTQYTLTVERRNFTGSDNYYGYNVIDSVPYGELTPTTFRGSTIASIETFNTTTFYFYLQSAGSGAGFWDRMEFIRNGALEKTIFSGQCSYLSGIGGEALESWTATSVGWAPVEAATYTVRIYF